MHLIWLGITSYCELKRLKNKLQVITLFAPKFFNEKFYIKMFLTSKSLISKSINLDNASNLLKKLLWTIKIIQICNFNDILKKVNKVGLYLYRILKQMTSSCEKIFWWIR